MAPILPPQLTLKLNQHESKKCADVKQKIKETSTTKKGKKQTIDNVPLEAENIAHDAFELKESEEEQPATREYNNLDSKPLPQLTQKVKKAIEREDHRLKKKKEAIQRLNQALLHKASTPLPETPKFSPLSPSLPPIPLPKDTTSFQLKLISSDFELQSDPNHVLELEPEPEPEPELEPERLSLEEDYPNRTVYLDELVSTEYRNRSHNMTNRQWYFDEYSGIYRQNAPFLSSTPNLHESITPSLHRSHSLAYSKSTTGSKFTPTENWPAPTTVDHVYILRKKARATKDRQKQLDFCRTLMDTACKDEVETFVNASPLPGTPLVSTRYHQRELRKKKKKERILDEVLVLEAQKMLKKLAIGSVGSGNSEAQFLLANCYGVGGLGLPLNRERAFALYIHASKQNHAESTYRAGVCYEIGIGTKKDFSRAITFYRKAATLSSHVASMYKLAVIYLRGFRGEKVNIREAVTWLQRASALATSQNAHAMYVLALFQFTQEFANTNLIADSSYALELLNTSAKFEYVPSQVKLGELYEAGILVEVDDALSIYWYTKAATHGNADAAMALSSWYLTGSAGVLEQSDREAYLWARKAASCQMADRWTIAKAYFLVGMYIDKKIGIDKDSTENAFTWFKRSAALGHRGALDLLRNRIVINNDISLDDDDSSNTK